jgi:hypothetical protein
MFYSAKSQVVAANNFSVYVHGGDEAKGACFYAFLGVSLGV